ncbi:HET-C-related protein [Pseudomonas putida]|uniref:HET-C-related protein n=1 Tax=Pseudomonas putida TaxID=303 RepID=UPI003D0449E1
MPIEPNANDALLISTYELGRLDDLARRTDETVFIALFMSVFGTDLTVDTYKKMRVAIQDRTLANPQYAVEPDGSGLARYDRTRRTIFVTADAITQSESDDHSSVNLFIAMARAFGEYLDNVLREDLSDGNEDVLTERPADVAAEVGAAYADMILFGGIRVADGTVYANYAGADLCLKIPNLAPPPKLARFVAGEADAKPGSFGHETLEKGLASAGFTDEERRSIYFGNWLRDYSQLLDPKIVRRADAPKNFPSKLSRAALTQVVDVLALKAFHDLQDTPEGRSAYTVTEKMLGVYRASEHIDNPMNPAPDASDPQEIDTDFEPLVTHGHPLLRVEPGRSIPGYIDNAARCMHDKLVDACYAGNTIDGRRYLGEALHILEDYFAHSNFVELCLRKRGHNVLPWTTETDCKYRFPVVTGMFASLDVIASIAEPLGKILFEVKTLDFELTKPGYRSDGEKVLLILFKEHESETALNWLNTYLKLRDNAAAQPLFGVFQAGRWLSGLPLTLLQNAINFTMRSILKWVGDSIDEIQTLSGHNPNETPGLHPTHSQLAKDHTNHPFHELAAYLAIYAVEQVGRSMYRYWQGETERDPASVALSFILHPEAHDWHEDIVAAWEAKDPKGSRSRIQVGSQFADLIELQAQLKKEEQERVEVLGESFRNAPNTLSDMLAKGFHFG